MTVADVPASRTAFYSSPSSAMTFTLASALRYLKVPKISAMQRLIFIGAGGYPSGTLYLSLVRSHA